MNWLMPEPACDIRAQLDALLDPRHPKTAVFAAPGNVRDLLLAQLAPEIRRAVHLAESLSPLFLSIGARPFLGCLGEVQMASRREGTLVTADAKVRAAFWFAMPDEAGMAAILGYPEPKDAAMAACPEAWLRVVQALDWRGHVITEALCSPGWLERTKTALEPHGNIRILTVNQTLGRRFALRCEEAA